MRIMVMDGQGGGIGATLIKGLREALGNGLEIYAVGTNSVATSRMMKAGANRGATGENAVRVASARVQIIAGSLSILVPDAMMGEVTPAIAHAVGCSAALKILLPLTQENIRLIGVSGEPLPHLVQEAVKAIAERMEHV